MKKRWIGLLVFLFPLVLPHAEKGRRPTVDMKLTLAKIYDSANPQVHVFVVDGIAVFQTYSGLKSYLALFPKGSTLTWSPGCMLDGTEPLLHSQSEMQDFSKYLDSLGIKFKRIPSG
jgi:hypothetical protein